jgi:hypothetical protein
VISVHHGREDIMEKNRSHHGNWEEEGECLHHGLSLVPPFIPPGAPGYGLVLPHSGWAILSQLILSGNVIRDIEVCFANLLGTYQYNQVENHDGTSQVHHLST